MGVSSLTYKLDAFPTCLEHLFRNRLFPTQLDVFPIADLLKLDLFPIQGFINLVGLCLSA